MYHKIYIGYNGASGAGGDVATNFEIDNSQTRWFVETFFEGLKKTKNTSGFIRIKGSEKSIVLSRDNWKEPDYGSLELIKPFNRVTS